MSKRMHAGILGLGLAVCMAGSAHARIDNGPISSLYDGDGRKSLSRHYSNERPSARKASRKSVQYRSKGRKQAYRKKSRNGVSVAKRSVTHVAHSGGGAGTSRSCLQAQARALLDRIEAQFGPVNIVSTCRPGAVIAGSGKPSKHRYGLAVDFEAGGRKAAIVNWLRANHHAGGTMTYARMSHIHVDIGPRFVSLGSGGGRRKG
jgi:hypothetical protein